jgi:GntR family transcriptional regulator
MAQPLYLQIADELEDQIKSGDLSPGSQLPTEDDLRDRYRASRNTVRDAIKRLVDQGLVETKPGQGTFVTKPQTPFVTVLTAYPKVSVGEGATYLDDVSAEDREASTSVPQVELQTTAPAEVTRRLRVPKATQLISRHQKRYIDNLPWSLQTSFYPMEFAGDAPRLLLSEDITEGAVSYLRETIGLTQIGFRDWITARRSDGNEQRFFRIPRGSTVFEIFRTGFDQHKNPMRVTVTVYPTDRNQFIVNVGDDLPDPRYDDLQDQQSPGS